MRCLDVSDAGDLDFANVGLGCSRTHFLWFRVSEHANQSFQYLEESFGGSTQPDIYFWLLYTDFQHLTTRLRTIEHSFGNHLQRRCKLEGSHFDSIEV